MKRTFSILTMALLFSTAMVFSQNKVFRESTPETRAKIHTTWMETALNLTVTQVEQVTPINLKYARQMEQVKSDDLSKIEKWRIIKNIEKLRVADFKNVLSPEQLKIYQEKKKELFKKAKERQR